MNAYRIYDPVEDKFCSSGRGLYSSNGRTIWISKSGAKLALKHMPPEIKDRLVLKEYTLIETPPENT